MLAFFDLSSQINIIYLTLIEKLSLIIEFTNLYAYKTDDTIFKTYKIVIAIFSVIDQANKIKFLKKIFLIANINSNIVFEMFFFILNSIDINFAKKKL